VRYAKVDAWLSLARQRDRVRKKKSGYIFWKQIEILGSTMSNQREFREVMKLIFRGELEPVIDSVFRLTSTRGARAFGKGEQFGKIVMTI